VELKGRGGETGLVCIRRELAAATRASCRSQ